MQRPLGRRVRPCNRENGMDKILTGCMALALVMAGCSPTVRVEAPKEPITINLNVKIQHEIKVKVEKELDSVLSPDSGLF